MNQVHCRECKSSSSFYDISLAVSHKNLLIEYFHSHNSPFSYTYKGIPCADELVTESLALFYAKQLRKQHKLLANAKTFESKRA